MAIQKTTGISKNSFISIGLVIVIIVASFYVGGSYYEVKTRLHYVEQRLNNVENLLTNLNHKIDNLK